MYAEKSQEVKCKEQHMKCSLSVRLWLLHVH